MNSPPQRDTAPEVTSDSPGVLTQPPLIYVSALILGLILERFVSLRDLPGWASWTFGLPISLAGLTLGLWFVTTMRSAQTAIDISKPASRIVTDGPFRFSRNPGYVSLTLSYVGLSILADALWPLLLLPVVLVVMQRTVIQREEAYLQRKFGQPYLTYKASTRRWI